MAGVSLARRVTTTAGGIGRYDDEHTRVLLFLR